MASTPRQTRRKASGGVLFFLVVSAEYGMCFMPVEPPIKRTVEFLTVRICSTPPSTRSGTLGRTMIRSS